MFYRLVLKDYLISYLLLNVMHYASDGTHPSISLRICLGAKVFTGESSG